MLTLMKFYADWCGPCSAMLPTMENLKEEFKDQVIFSDINIEDNPQVRLDYQIRSIPAFILLKDRKEVARKIGSANLSDMQEWIEEYRA